MKLILDEWIVREVIDTLYAARTTLLGITGLDSPQEVAKKSSKETAITRRISKAIDIIQQSEHPDVGKAANKYLHKCDIDGIPTTSYTWDDMVDCFRAGAEWQKQQFEKNRLAACDAQTTEE